MMIGPAQEGDRDEVTGFYRRIHPDAKGQFTLKVRTDSRTFVARRDGGGAVLGVATASYLDCGVAPDGIIHQLEVSPEHPKRKAVLVRGLRDLA